jgi:plastocyanin
VLATAAIDAGVAFAPASPRIVRVTLSRSAPDRSVSFTFAKTGSYAYSCGLHPRMQGRIVVTP